MELPEGHRLPRILHTPGPVVGTLGQEAIDLSSMAGLDLDPWQKNLMIEGCSVNPENTYWNKYTKRQEAKWAALEMSVVVSRQNGKGSWLEARELAGLFLFGERTIIHSAHQFDTSKEHFNRIVSLIEDTPELRREIPLRGGISNTHGSEGITLKNGQRLLFKTRTNKGGRGFTGDLLVLDEAMFLGAEEIGALMPTLAARPNAQILYTGSAGDQELGDCSQLGRLRTRALKRDDLRLLFAEWSIEVCNEFCPMQCDEHDDPFDVESYAKANPGFGHRIGLDHIEMERRSMELRTFLTERLGVGNYPVEGEAWKVIPKDSWEGRQDVFSQLSRSFALAVDITPDRSRACIAVAGAQDADSALEHVEITGRDQDDLDHREGTQWLVPRILELWERHKPGCVVIDNAGHAGGMIEELEKHHVKVVIPNAREYAQACGEFRSAVVPQKGETATLVHLGQPPLAAALAEADKRKLTDMWAWDKRSSSADISPLVAATLAKWGYKRHVHSTKAADPWIAFGWGDDE